MMTPEQVPYDDQFIRDAYAELFNAAVAAVNEVTVSGITYDEVDKLRDVVGDTVRLRQKFDDMMERAGICVEGMKR